MSLASLSRFYSVCLASGFGSGYSRIAPGTCGSLAALGGWWVLHQSLLFTGAGNVALCLLTTLVGCIAVKFSLKGCSGNPDPSWIVIDEWAGLFVALIGVTPSDWHLVMCAFVLFRLFDATKLGPVGWAERLPGCWGIMADDLVAGGLTTVVMALLR